MTDQKLIDDVVTAFADRDITAPSREDIARVLEVFETSLRRCGCDDCTTARRERIGLTEHDLTSLARVLHEVVYSPGASFDRAVPGIQEYMRACAEKVAAALPWVVPTPEVELVVAEAHTPTDDEREALIALGLASYSKIMSDGYPSGVMRTNEEAADLVLAAGFRRSEVPEPSATGPAFIALMPPSPETSKRWYSMYCRACGIEEMMAETEDDPRLVARRDAHNRERHAEPQGEPSDAEVDAAADAMRERMEAIQAYAGDIWPGMARVALRAAREVRAGAASEVPEPSAEERDLIDTANQMRRQTSSGIKPGSLIGLWLRTASALEARIKRPSEPQGEPSDAQVEAAAQAMFEPDGPGGDYTWAEMVVEDPSRADIWREDARKVLRAAGGAR